MQLILYRKILAVWVVEIMAEMTLLTLWRIILFFRGDSFDGRFPRDLFATAYVILSFMFISGYLLFSLYLRLIWKSQRVWDYCVITTVYVIITLQIFLTIADGWETSFKLKLQLASAVTIFACTFAGGWFIKNHSPHIHSGSTNSLRVSGVSEK